MDDDRARLTRTRRLALAVLLAAAPAWAQESLSVKELLDRAQTKPQTEAVEDLIRKLKGVERTPDKPPPEPPRAASEKAPSTPLEESPPQIAETPPAPAAEERQSPLSKGSEPRPVEVAAPTQQEPATGPDPAAPTQTGPPPSPLAAAPPQPDPAVPPATAPPVPPPVAKTEISEPLPSVDLEVHFDYKSAKISSRAVDLLATLGRALTDERLAGQTFLIAGHTDAKGGDTYNLKLSLARAEAVREFLITHFGIAPERLRAEGHGLRQLKNPRLPFAAENRRVQVTNITPQTARP
jgi:outer membrane protein OmpA-like peptidoglycan-associated protein